MLALLLPLMLLLLLPLLQGDAEDLPFASDSFDRYVSAGSIEYWPEPQRGITEAYRVTKPGGIACIIGPVHPTHPVSRCLRGQCLWFKMLGCRVCRSRKQHTLGTWL
jgi:ubiquinone/menaquinone biosynthesis C-methylase UbiE